MKYLFIAIIIVLIILIIGIFLYKNFDFSFSSHSHDRNVSKVSNNKIIKTPFSDKIKNIFCNKTYKKMQEAHDVFYQTLTRKSCIMDYVEKEFICLKTNEVICNQTIR